jgi:hypothetical protein
MKRDPLDNKLVGLLPGIADDTEARQVGNISSPSSSFARS